MGQYLAGSAVRILLLPLRISLKRYVRAEPAATPGETHRKVVFLLMNAWAMGGTIRAVHSLAEYLAASYEVEIVSVLRRRERPFFAFPHGVTVTTLHDRRPGVASPGLLRKLLERCPSVLMHPADSNAGSCSLLVDLMLVRELRGRSGFLVGTRPGLNLIAAELSPPGLVTIGQEHLNLRSHSRILTRALERGYPALDALAVLTEEDRRDYARMLGGRGGCPRIVRLPNSVRDLGGGSADLDERMVLAAGRLTPQKGFDLLVRAFAGISPAHPEWRLRICGEGRERETLRRLIDAQGLAGVVDLPGRRDLGKEMAGASIFVLSSRLEGFPLVLLEALSMGMAVVSFDCPTGPRDIVEHERNGLLVPAGDVDALADAVGRVMVDEDLRRRIGAAGIETARAYGMDQIGPQWDALLAELAVRRSSVRSREAVE
jgi:glycosyltransferase involved in cell wall biosynthesis